MQKIKLTASAVTSKPDSIIERVKSFEDACLVLGITGEIFNAEIHDSLSTDMQAIVAHTQLMIIAKALNEGWTPDWSNEDEYKYYPWWELQNGFQLNCVNYHFTNSRVSSRLCFKTEALAKYAATQFIDLYKQYFLISK